MILACWALQYGDAKTEEAPGTAQAVRGLRRFRPAGARPPSSAVLLEENLEQEQHTLEEVKQAAQRLSTELAAQAA